MKKLSILFLSLLLLLSCTFVVMAGCKKDDDNTPTGTPTNTPAATSKPDDSKILSQATGALMESMGSLMVGKWEADIAVKAYTRDDSGVPVPVCDGALKVKADMSAVTSITDVNGLKALNASADGSLTYHGENQFVKNLALVYAGQTVYARVSDEGNGQDIKIKATAGGIENLIALIAPLLPGESAQNLAQLAANTQEENLLTQIMSSIVDAGYTQADGKIISSLTFNLGQVTPMLPDDIKAVFTINAADKSLESVEIARMTVGNTKLDFSVAFKAAGFDEILAPEDAETYVDVDALTAAVQNTVGLGYYELNGTLSFSMSSMVMEAVDYTIQIQPQTDGNVHLLIEAQSTSEAKCKTYFDGEAFYFDYLSFDGVASKTKVLREDAITDFPTTILVQGLGSSFLAITGTVIQQMIQDGTIGGSGLEVTPDFANIPKQIVQSADGIQIVLNMDPLTGGMEGMSVGELALSLALKKSGDKDYLNRLKVNVSPSMGMMALDVALDFTLDETAAIEGSLLAELVKTDYKTREQLIDEAIAALGENPAADAVEAVQEMYDNATETVKSKVTKLDLLQAAHDKLMDEELAEIVVLIDALVGADAITAENVEDVSGALQEIHWAIGNQLTDEQLAKITNLKKYEAVLEAYKTFRARQIDDAIDALPSNKAITLNDKTEVAKIVSLYNGDFFQEGIQAKVTLKADLDAAVDKIARLEAAAISAKIAGIGSTENLTIAKAGEIAGINTEYNKLDALAKSKVSEAMRKTLIDANTEAGKVLKAEVNRIIELIKALPASDAVTAENKTQVAAQVQAIDAALEALPESYQNSLGSANSKKLEDVKAALAALETPAAA